MSPLLWTTLIATLTAMACALCGTFLVVKREAFVSEGLSHAVLPGIVLMFIIIQDRYSPWLFIAASVSGVLMILISQMISKTGLVDNDAALGITFSGMFSLGVIASSWNLKNVHFHADCIIDGNLAFSPLNDFHCLGIYWGPQSFVIMVIANLLLIGFIAVFYKELKLLSFDETTAQLYGFRPRWLHLVWLSLVSFTAVVAFEIAGTILVVALMIAPAAAANLIAVRLGTMLWLSCVIGMTGAITGTLLGYHLGIAPTGPIATISGILFMSIVAINQIRRRREI